MPKAELPSLQFSNSLFDIQYFPLDMKRPWQIWTLFLLCLAFVVPAMIWLTMKALELDRQRSVAEQQTKQAHQQEFVQRQQAETARSESELQGVIASALWQMDWTLTPVVAQEAARPYYVYDSFFNASVGKGSVQPVPSPLLIQPSEFVLLHFQLSPDSQWTSPQNPIGVACDLAIQNGTTLDNVRTSGTRLTNLKQQIKYDDLLALLPEELLPTIEVRDIPWGNNFSVNYDGNRLLAGNGQKTKDFGIKQLKEQQPVEDMQQEVQFLQESFLNEPPQQDANPQRASRSNSQRGSPRQAPSPQAQQAYFPQSVTRRQELLRDVEWQTRNRAYESFAINSILQQRYNSNSAAPSVKQVVREGVTRPAWVGEKLILARRVVLGDKVYVQGCWLDWPKIKAMLMEEIDHLLPEVDLVPVTPDNAENVPAGRMLATLPVQIVVPNAILATAINPPQLNRSTVSDLPKLSPIQLSLIIAWSCMVLAAGAVAILLRGVVTLSERRGAFVAAVTHELRTPLTTFRMYAEMLAGGMVPSEEKRQKYMETLRVEADRLAHLVENVLAYARLERGRPGRRREKICVAKLFENITPRLEDRATQAKMNFVIEADESTQETVVNTDPGAVEQVLFNLVDNACKYAGAVDDRRVHLRATVNESTVQFAVIDHGPGITASEAKRLFQPFSKSVQQAANSAPGVGLGLALCRRLASELGGQLDLESGQECGAEFLLTLPRK